MIQSSPHEIDCGPNGLAIRRSQDEDAVLDEQFIKSIKELEAGFKADDTCGKQRGPSGPILQAASINAVFEVNEAKSLI